jgi:Ca-activated chloride channel family protein
MHFASPEWLFGLLILPLLGLVDALCARRDRERVARLVARPLWPRILRREDERLRYLRLGLLLLGASGIVLALARPQWGVTREKVEREGADVVLLLDSSGSMATADVPPSRFFLAKNALLSLVARLEGDRFGLVAFEGEAYPLVPLTLDADAVGLFLDSLEPGFLPTPGSSLAQGVDRGLELFVDPARRNKVMVLVSDGEDLEGEVEAAVRRAREAGVVIHAVGVGTERGEPVPELDADGRSTGFKKDENGQVVVSRLDEAALEGVARATGGRYFRLTASDPTLSALVAAIASLEQASVAREYAYRPRERYQWPLAVGFFALALAFALPLPRRRGRAPAPANVLLRAAAVVVLLGPAGALAQGAADPSPPSPGPAPPAAPGPSPAPEARPRGARLVDEVLLRPRRLTDSGRRAFEKGDHPKSLQEFEGATAVRPEDPAARFNLADGLYKNGRFDEAAALYRDLGNDAASPLAGAARYNLGNSLYQKQDYPGAIRAYRDALRAAGDDADARRNLELALRALQEQERQPKPDPKDPKDRKEQKDQKDQKPQGGAGQGQERPQTPDERERQRFERETGMPKERAMQLLEALQRNEQSEQRKALLAKRRPAKGKDW